MLYYQFAKHWLFKHIVREAFSVTAEEIFEKVQEMIAEQFSVDKSKVTLECSLQEDLDADSLDLVDLAVSIEQEFDLDETDERLVARTK